MTNLYTSLEQRLREVANGDYKDAQEHNNPTRSALICINLIFSQSGALLGWYTPQVIRLEPKDLNPFLIAECERIEDWQQVVDWLSENKRDRTLLIRLGEPVVWLP